MADSRREVRYPDLPDDQTAVVAVLGTIRRRVADAFVQVEALQASMTHSTIRLVKVLEALQEDLADIQVTQLPALESMFGVMFVNIDFDGSVMYDQLPE
ncbi:MAG: hypothetical protein JXB47_05020 [Anaerolineae bacterium]|nr:hypothetical protein [Anaerolineae bacterium]